MFGRDRGAAAKPPRVILLTGAAHGIGRATALALAEQGHALGLLDRDATALEALRDQLAGAGRPVASARADVSDATSTRDAATAVAERLGAIEVLVACAGVGRLSSATDLDLDGLRDMLLVNVLGVANAINAVLPGMYARGSGHLVGISSVAGFRGMPWMPGYSASKAALSTYLEGLRPALKRRGVRITTVNPGFVRTGLTVTTPFRKPVPMLEPEEAARHIARVVRDRPREHTFPFTTAVGMGILRRLPNVLFDLSMDQAGPKALSTEF